MPGSAPGPILLVVMGASVVAGLALVFRITIVGFTSATTIRDFEETRFITPKVWRVCGTLRSPEERRECGPGALPLLGSRGGVPRVSWVHSLLANLKHKSGNEGVGREEQGHSGSVLGYLGLSNRRTS